MMKHYVLMRHALLLSWNFNMVLIDHQTQPITLNHMGCVNMCEDSVQEYQVELVST